jgi:hypothetical protein
MWNIDRKDPLRQIRDDDQKKKADMRVNAKSFQTVRCILAMTMIVVAAQVLEPPIPAAGPGYSSGKTSFAVKIRDNVSPYEIIYVSVLPGEKLDIEIVEPDGQSEFRLDAEWCEVRRNEQYKWTWSAPAGKGMYPLNILEIASGDRMIVNAFVVVPISEKKGEDLNGYRIGSYPAIPLRQLPIYTPPKGFIEVTEENLNTRVSPHFTLSQFLCKQEGGFPKYLVLRTKLLLKLELILEKVNEKGYACSTFNVLSGYRTPYYNKLIGNVKYSRHLWGGAADIFIDENPPDDMMDDLNNDGKNDYHDAAILYDIIDGMYGKSLYQHFIGGLGRYRKSSLHGPFVHVDVRGFRARWGD